MIIRDTIDIVEVTRRLKIRSALQGITKTAIDTREAVRGTEMVVEVIEGRIGGQDHDHLQRRGPQSEDTEKGRRGANVQHLETGKTTVGLNNDSTLSARKWRPSRSWRIHHTHQCN